jgi:hypothetical protein
MRLEVWIPLAVAIVAPLGAYLLAARKFAGKVDTTDADRLWLEAKNIRDDYRERLLNEGLARRDLEVRVARLEGANNELQRENYALQNKIVALEALVSSLRDTIKKLEDTIMSQAKELGKEKRLNGH